MSKHIIICLLLLQTIVQGEPIYNLINEEEKVEQLQDQASPLGFKVYTPVFEHVDDVQMPSTKNLIETEQTATPESNQDNQEHVPQDEGFFIFPQIDFGLGDFFSSEPANQDDFFISPFSFQPPMFLESLLDLLPAFDNIDDSQEGFISFETITTSDGKSTTTVTKNLRSAGQAPVFTREVFTTENGISTDAPTDGVTFQEVITQTPQEYVDENQIINTYDLTDSPETVELIQLDTKNQDQYNDIIQDEITQPQTKQADNFHIEEEGSPKNQEEIKFKQAQTNGTVKKTQPYQKFLNFLVYHSFGFAALGLCSISLILFRLSKAKQTKKNL